MHNIEDFKSGLPNAVKKEVALILSAAPSSKPSQIRTLVRAKFPNINIPLKKVQGFVKRTRDKSKDVFMENTIGGIASFVQDHPFADDIAPNALFVLDSDISDERSIICMSSLALLRLMYRSVEMYQMFVFSLDGTYKLLWNGFPFIVCGLSDIMHRFHPIAFLFTSHEDKDAYSFLINSIKSFVCVHLSFDMEPNYCISDNADEIFSAVTAEFPDTIKVNCYAQMMRNVRKSYRKDLTEKVLMNHIIADLRKIQSLCFEDDAKRAFALFFEKYASEVTFLDQFKASYYNGFKKNFVRVFLLAGVPCSNNGLERFNQTIKQTLAFHQRLSAREFLDGLVEWTRQISEDHSAQWPHHAYDMRVVDLTPSVQTRIRDVYRKAQLEEFETLESANSFYFRATNSDPTVEIKELVRDWTAHDDDDNESFMAFITRCLSVWALELAEDVHFTCSCPQYVEYMFCKHWVALCVDKGHLSIPNELSVESLGRKRKRGRSKKLPSALLRDDE